LPDARTPAALVTAPIAGPAIRRNIARLLEILFLALAPHADAAKDRCGDLPETALMPFPS
jgi:hypothetical protein